MRTAERMRTPGVFAAALLASGLISAAACASTVAPMELAAMADHAGQVIVGEVVSTRSYWAENPRRIETEVVFGDVQYLKGALPDADSTFRMIIPGGQVGEMGMRVCCTPEFETGEKWMLMLLPTYRTFPVVGLHRGAFRIAKDAAGIERMLSFDRQPVTGIDAEGFVEIAGQRAYDPHGHRHNAGAAHNLRIEVPEAAEAAREAMAFDAFRTKLQPVLNASRDHRLAEPAGRRVLVEYQPTSLKGVPGRATGSSGAGTRGGAVTEVEPASREGRGQ